MASAKTIAERLTERSVLDLETGCVLWSGARTPAGYGVIGVGGKLAYTHRLAYEIEYGPIPPGMLICHRCDTPGCLNASGGHLFLGTDADNMRDKAAKGRHHSQKKTHCPAGHPYAGANLYIEKKPTGGSYRQCRECAISRSRARQGTDEYRKYDRERKRARRAATPTA